MGGARSPRGFGAGGLVFGGVLFLLGTALLGLAGRAVAFRVAASDWQPVDATVVQSSERTVTKTSHDQGKSPTKTVRVFRYRYEVEGARHLGQRVTFSTGDGDVERAVETFEEGEAITVWVDPDDPARATVWRELGGGAMAVGAMGLVAWALAAALAWPTKR